MLDTIPNFGNRMVREFFEYRPTATIGAIWLDALKGAALLLAPGMLALVAIIAIASTYYHPALGRDPSDRG